MTMTANNTFTNSEKISLNAEFICNHEPFTSFVHHLAYMAVFFINQHNSHDTITIYGATSSSNQHFAQCTILIRLKEYLDMYEEFEFKNR